jgi:hypothetical protein
MAARALAASSLLASLACGRQQEDPDTGASANMRRVDTALDGDDPTRVDTSCQSPHAQGATDPRWCLVDRLLDQSLAAPVLLPGYSFQVFDSDAAGRPTLRYSRAAGMIESASGAVQAASDQLLLKVASGSKYLTSLTVLRAIRILRERTGSNAALSLDTTAGNLACAGVDSVRNAITLREALHLIGGTGAVDQSCVTSLQTSLKDCACEVLSKGIRYPVGSAFAYGSDGFVLAAAIAERALAPLQLTFDDVVAELATALGVPGGAIVVPATNMYAGAFQVTPAAYARFLALSAPGTGRGRWNGRVLVDAADIDALSTPFGSGVRVAFSPFSSVGLGTQRYGLGSWVLCAKPWATPETWPNPAGTGAATFGFVQTDYENCVVKVQHSLGKFGFMPWVSAPRNGGRGHFAVLATKKDSTSTGQVSMDSFTVFTMIEPLLAQLLP